MFRFKERVCEVATIIDVARYAGVSKSTVSLVLNNSPLVKEETRIHVEKAIQALGYVCNNNARGLRTKETKCLGVIIAIERSSAKQAYTPITLQMVSRTAYLVRTTA